MELKRAAVATREGDVRLGRDIFRRTEGNGSLECWNRDNPMGEGEAESDPAGVGATRFSATLWSVVLLAGQHPSPQSEQALATLCRAYWYPLYAFIRRNGHDLADAQDLTQAFFVHLLDHHRLGQVRREKGKFRSFLLASLRNFLADQRDKAQAQKRGGQASVISLDTAEDSYRLEPVHTLSPEKLFERR